MTKNELLGKLREEGFIKKYRDRYLFNYVDYFKKYRDSIKATNSFSIDKPDLNENRKHLHIAFVDENSGEVKANFIGEVVENVFLIGLEGPHLVINEKGLPFAYFDVYEGGFVKMFGDWMIFSGHEEIIGFNLSTLEMESVHTR